MMWARRLLIGSGLAVGSLALASGVAGAAATGCGSMSGPSCSVTPPTVGGTSTTPVLPTTAANSQLPYDGTSSAPSSTGGSSSLPFTGADIAELAVIGGAAVVVGGVLTRRRRLAS
jgi:hypothetical protein